MILVFKYARYLEQYYYNGKRYWLSSEALRSGYMSFDILQDHLEIINV